MCRLVRIVHVALQLRASACTVSMNSANLTLALVWFGCVLVLFRLKVVLLPVGVVAAAAIGFVVTIVIIIVIVVVTFVVGSVSSDRNGGYGRSETHQLCFTIEKLLEEFRECWWLVTILGLIHNRFVIFS